MSSFWGRYDAEGDLTMNHKEIDRLMVIEQCNNGTIRQSVAAQQPGISSIDQANRFQIELS